MNVLRNLITRVTNGSARFERYYGDVAHEGVGYPTADEARKDMLRHDAAVNRYGWVR
ncbi:MAG: hypothetical protein QM692_12405 [Thermomicrobiales bacterium]